MPKRVPKHDKFDRRAKNLFLKQFLLKEDEQPQLGQNDQLKLMPFQVSIMIFPRFPHFYTLPDRRIQLVIQ
jgi:hypothetical protein